MNKKKSLSCPAGGRYYGQSGGRNFFLSIFFFLVGECCPFLEKKNFWKNEKKKYPVGPFLDTRPLHRKQNFFLDWPEGEPRQPFFGRFKGERVNGWPASNKVT